MGVDLRLLFPLNPTGHVAHDMIDLNKDYELWAEINALPQVEIPEPIWSFVATAPDGDSYYGQIEKDPYGEKLKTVMSADLLTLAEHPNVLGQWRTRAAWAYIAQFPVNWKIILYWH